MSKRKSLNARFPLIVGFSAVALMLGGLGTWSVATEISGAVIASGTVVVENDRQVVQHPDGGVVGEILARDGDVVQAGEVLIRLDDTFIRSELAVVERQILEFYARRARLVAERDAAVGLDLAQLPPFDLVTEEEVAGQITGQTTLFEARRRTLQQEVAQLREQQVQIERQIDGFDAQLNTLTRQRGLITQDMANASSLVERGLAVSSRLLDLQREDARLEGDLGELEASKAEAETRIAALAIEILRLSERRREDAITELREIGLTEIELFERRASLAERIARLDVVAPATGTVFGSTVFTIGAVIQAAEPAMYVVPNDQPLLVSTRIDAADIDNVFVGQDVSLMFSAFAAPDMPNISGSVTRVAADALQDEVTGMAYYQGIIAPDQSELAAAGIEELTPGMPVDAFLQTQERSPLTYLTEPLTVFFERALRDE